MHQQTCTISNVCAKQHFIILYKINIELGWKSTFKVNTNVKNKIIVLCFITVIQCEYTEQAQ